MDRRSFLKLIALGVVSHELDIDRLLWVPGEKKIFLPPKGVSISDIVAVELERVLPKIRTLFERDDYFYAVLQKQQKLIIEGSEMRVPLEVRPGHNPKNTIH